MGSLGNMYLKCSDWDGMTNTNTPFIKSALGVSEGLLHIPKHIFHQCVHIHVGDLCNL